MTTKKFTNEDAREVLLSIIRRRKDRLFDIHEAIQIHNDFHFYLADECKKELSKEEIEYGKNNMDTYKKDGCRVLRLILHIKNLPTNHSLFTNFVKLYMRTLEEEKRLKVNVEDIIMYAILGNIEDGILERYIAGELCTPQECIMEMESLVDDTLTDLLNIIESESFFLLAVHHTGSPPRSTEPEHKAIS